MDLRTLRNVSLASVVLATAAFGQGSVFSLDGGSQTSYIAGVQAAGSTSINLINSGFQVTGSSAGNMCVNVYAFNATPQVVMCCSCLVLANQAVNVAIQSDLLTLSPVPGSVTVHLLAAPTSSNGNGTSCAGTASTVTQAQIVPFGMTAFKNSVSWRAGSSSETPFTPFILGPVTVGTLATQCAAAAKQTCTCSAGAQ